MWYTQFCAPTKLSLLIVATVLHQPGIAVFTRYQAEPGNADAEALPPIFPNEAEPLDIGSQAEPRNQLF